MLFFHSGSTNLHGVKTKKTLKLKQKKKDNKNKKTKTTFKNFFFPFLWNCYACAANFHATDTLVIPYERIKVILVKPSTPPVYLPKMYRNGKKCLFAKVLVYEISSCVFESRCSHLNFICHPNFEQRSSSLTFRQL